MRAPNGRFIAVKRTVLRDSNRGRNKRGVCAHKRTKYTKPAKRQQVGGYIPHARTGGGRIIG